MLNAEFNLMSQLSASACSAPVDAGQIMIWKLILRRSFFVTIYASCPDGLSHF